MCEAEQLVVDNIGLAKKVANRNVGRMEFDDLQQLCSVSLMKAAKTFDPEKGTQFSTYACRIMQNDIYSQLRKNWENYEKEVYGDDIYSTLNDTVTIDDAAEAIVLVEQIKKALTEDEFTVLYMFHVDGYRQPYIAKVIGTTQPQVSKILKRAKAKARMALGTTY